MNSFEVQEPRKTNSRKNRNNYRKNGNWGCRILLLLSLIIILAVIIAALLLFHRFSSQETEEEKYGGHGFDYMKGYSSTDFTGYHVYDGEKLVTLENPSKETLDRIIENVDDMPVLDGAEACYPVYAAVAKTLYKDIDKIELDAMKQLESDDPYDHENDYLYDWDYSNGRVVSFTNTFVGYERIVSGEADLFFGARPSQHIKDMAAEYHEEVVSIPIGREAFVFFVEEDNPVENLTSDEVRKIYSGEITNWNEVGGKNQKIVAFQRPGESGSQVMMNYFMGDVPLMEPDTYTMVSAMGGVLEEVKQYHNEKGAIGYTFQYFLTGLQQEDGVKMLSVDGVYPSVEHIKDGSYPITVNLVCAKLASNKDPNVQKVVDFLLSDDGQELIERTGYGPLPRDEKGNVISNPTVENKMESGVIYELDSTQSDGEHEGRLLLTEHIFELTHDDMFIKGSIMEESPETIVISPGLKSYRENGIVEMSLSKDSEENSLTITEVIEEPSLIRPNQDGEKEFNLELLPKEGERFLWVEGSLSSLGDTSEERIDSFQLTSGLHGTNPTLVKEGDPYIESGAFCIHHESGVVKNMEISGNVDTSKPGDYTITYTFHEAGETETINRKVQVIPTGEFDEKTDGVPVFMYHYVYTQEDPPGTLNGNYILDSELELQLQWLKENDYYYPSFAELRAFVDGEISLPMKSCILTFDDGQKGFLNYGIPLLEKYVIPAVSFLIVSNDAEEIMKSHPSEFISYESHSYNMHRAGGNIGHGGIISALTQEEIEEDLQVAIDVLGTSAAFAYPYGDYTDDAQSAVREAGILCAFTTEYDWVRVGDNPSALPRVRIVGDAGLEAFQGSM